MNRQFQKKVPPREEGASIHPRGRPVHAAGEAGTMTVGQGGATGGGGETRGRGGTRLGGGHEEAGARTSEPRREGGRVLHKRGRMGRGQRDGGSCGRGQGGTTGEGGEREHRHSTCSKESGSFCNRTNGRLRLCNIHLRLLPARLYLHIGANSRSASAHRR